jgi:preprotein translocase subunit SecE
VATKSPARWRLAGFVPQPGGLLLTAAHDDKAMSTNPQVETLSTGADKAKLAGAAVLLVAGVAPVLLLDKQDLWVRVLALLAADGRGGGAVLHGGVRQAAHRLRPRLVREVKKVVWPTARKRCR